MDFVKFVKKSLSKKYNHHSLMDRCKVYRDYLKVNCIDDESKRQLKQVILNELNVLDALKK